MMMGGPGGGGDGGYQKYPGHGGMGVGLGGGAGGAHDVSGFSSIMGSMNLGMGGGPGGSGAGDMGGGAAAAGGMGGLPGMGLDHTAMAPPSTSRLFNDWRFGSFRSCSCLSFFSSSSCSLEIYEHEIMRSIGKRTGSVVAVAETSDFFSSVLECSEN